VVGRALCGFISIKSPDRIFIRVMMLLVLAATILFLFSTNAMLPPVFLFMGIAGGPVFPLLIHETPSIVGAENAQGVIGIQLAASSLGTALVPLLLGVVAGRLGFWVFRVFLIVLVAAALTLKLIQDHKYGEK
jgi:predicted MFS family arabinose efflux permease